MCDVDPRKEKVVVKVYSNNNKKIIFNLSSWKGGDEGYALVIDSSTKKEKTEDDFIEVKGLLIEFMDMILKE